MLTKLLRSEGASASTGKAGSQSRDASKTETKGARWALFRPIATDVPSSWDDIKPGHIVLACDSLVEGWWAAVVVDRSNDKLGLRWRDYPGYPKFTVRASAVALLNPAAF